jgi:hypothetical protein
MQAAKELFLLVDNVSDLFPALLSTQAVLRFAYHPHPYMPTPVDPNATAVEAAYCLHFATEQYSIAMAPAVVSLYTSSTV